MLNHVEVPLLLQREEHPSASAKVKGRAGSGKIEVWMVATETQEHPEFGGKREHHSGIQRATGA